MLNKEEGHIWESVSDLMTGMMMVFLFISLAFLLQMSMLSEQYTHTKVQILEDLTKEFPPNELKDMHAEINDKDGTVSFTTEGGALFEKGSSVPSYQFQQNLNKFFPRYVAILSQEKYKGKIMEIRIEGHASREWVGDPNSDDAYFTNMKLSQQRSGIVMEYVMRMPYVQDKKNWLRQYVTANGYSYSHSSKNNDYTKDRRVDFRVLLDAEKAIEGMQDASVIGKIGK